MTPELGFTWKEIIIVVFIAGGIWSQLQAIRKDIRRLEQKQDKYNNLQERTHDLEMWKQYHEKEHSVCQNSGKEVRNCETTSVKI